MKDKITITDLEVELNTSKTTLTNTEELHNKLHLEYNEGISLIEQLELELSDILHFKQQILKKIEETQIMTYGKSSKMGQLTFIHEGQLEGRFLEKMQSRIHEQQRIQEQTIEITMENIRNIKNKSQLIQENIDIERNKLLYVEMQMSTKQLIIQQQKDEINRLEGSIRMFT